MSKGITLVFYGQPWFDKWPVTCLVWYPIEIRNDMCLGSVLNADMHVLVAISDWYRFNICIFVQIWVNSVWYMCNVWFLILFLFLVLVVPYAYFCAHCASAITMIIQTPALSSVGGSRRVATVCFLKFTHSRVLLCFVNISLSASSRFIWSHCIGTPFL